MSPLSLIRATLALLLFAVSAAVAQADVATPPRAGALFRQPDAAALARDRDEKSRESVSVLDFCQAGDAARDATACVQAAVDSLCGRTAGGGTLLFPRGVYSIDAGTGIRVPCAGIHIAGQGWGDRDSGAGGTRIRVSGHGDRPIFDFRGPLKTGDRYFYGGSVRHLQFHADNPAGGVVQRGPMVRFNHCFGCLVEDVYAFNPYRFVVNFAGFQNRVTQFFADQIAFGGEAILFLGSDEGCEPDNIGNCPTRGDALEIDHGQVDAALSKGQTPGACIRLSDFAATTMITTVLCNQVSIGLNIDCPTSTQIGACPQFISAYDLEVEVNASADREHAAAIVAGDTVHLNCFDCQLYGSTPPVTLVKLMSARFAGAGDAQFFGGKVEGALGSCIESSVQGLAWHGGQIYGCNQDKRGAYAFDIRPNAVGGAAASGSTIITGTQLCYGIGNVPSPMAGVLLEPGSDYAVVTGNLLRGCAKGIVDRSGSLHNVIANNAPP